MEEQVVEKANEVEQYWQRMQELEEMYRQLKKALDDERQAKDDEEAVCKLQARCTNTQHSVYTHPVANVLGQRIMQNIRVFYLQAATRGSKQEAWIGANSPAPARNLIPVSERERRAGKGAGREGKCPAGCTWAAGEPKKTERGGARGIHGSGFILIRVCLGIFIMFAVSNQHYPFLVYFDFQHI